MKLPNKYGSVIKLGGKRRKPYAVRVTTGYKIFCVIPNKSKNWPLIKKYDMAYRKSSNDYIAEASDKLKRDLQKEKIVYKFSTRQQFRYLEYFEKSTDAYAYLAQFNAGADVKEHTSVASEPTFKDVYESFIDFICTLKNKPSETKLRAYKEGFHLWEDVHNLRFSAVTTKQLQDCLTQHGHLSKSTIGKMLTILKRLYKYALGHQICERDLSIYLFAEYSKEQKIVHTIFTDKEIEYLWARKDLEIAKVCLILIYTGMRASEFLRMNTKDIHLKERYAVGGMKTDAGKNRIIPLHKDIIPLIKSFYNKKNTYIFPTQSGGFYKIEKFRTVKWLNGMKELGMNHLTHDCRHTCATKLEAIGVSDLHRKLILGHTVRDITGGVYTHVSKEDLIRDIDLWVNHV